MTSWSIGSRIGQALDEAITEIHSMRDELSAKLQQLTDRTEQTLATQGDIQTRVKSLEDMAKTLGASEALQGPVNTQKPSDAGATEGMSREGGSSTVANPPVFVKPTAVPRKRRRRDEPPDVTADEETQELATQPLPTAGSGRASTTVGRIGGTAPAMNEAAKRGESDLTAKNTQHAAINDPAPNSLPSSSTLRASSSAPLLTRALAQSDKPSAMQVDGPVSATDGVSKMEKDMWRPSWLGAGKPGSLEDYIRERRTVIHGKDQGRETRTSTQGAIRTSIQVEKVNHSSSIPNTDDGDDDDDHDDDDIRYDQPAAKRVRQPTTRKPKASNTTRQATPQDSATLDAPSLKAKPNDSRSHSDKGNGDTTTTTTTTTKAPPSAPAPRKAAPAKAAKPPAPTKKPARAPNPARKRAPAAPAAPKAREADAEATGNAAGGAAAAADAGVADESADATRLLAAFQARRDRQGGKE